jgi:acyl-CoA thioesterase-1
MNSRRTFLKTTFALAPVFAFPKLMLPAKNSLPNVLILGDSISIGYTPFVKQKLIGWANIMRPMLENGKAENCQGTNNGVKNIKRWLGETKWDVIHFNFGLHDLKHVDPLTGKNSTNPNDPQQANLKQYKKNLTEIVEVLMETKAKLIFATTTPYPDKVDGPLRLPGMPKKYNKIATKIMTKNGIPINNLHAFVLPRMNEIQRPNNVHFTETGSKALAEKVADRIKEALDLTW